MNNIFICFIITFISGLSTMLGCLVILLNLKNRNRIISSSLIFSSSVMFFLSIFDLIPTAYNYINVYYEFFPSIIILFIYILFGSILIFLVDKKSKINNSLYKIGVISIISLIIHNIPEGIITFVSSSKELSVGIPLAFSIALHNIPEGIAISIPIYYSENNKKKAILYTLISALSEPLGGLLSVLFLNKINNYLFVFLLSLTSGIMIYLSIFDLLKEGRKYNNNHLFFYYFLGFIIMFLSIFII